MKGGQTHQTLTFYNLRRFVRAVTCQEVAVHSFPENFIPCEAGSVSQEGRLRPPFFICQDNWSDAAAKALN